MSSQSLTTPATFIVSADVLPMSRNTAMLSAAGRREPGHAQSSRHDASPAIARLRAHFPTAARQPRATPASASVPYMKTHTRACASATHQRLLLPR